jgi:uncharacterized protein (TIGR03435 family)
MRMDIRNGMALMLAGASILSFEQPVCGQGAVQFDAAAIKLDERGPGDRRMKGGPGTGSPGRVTWQKVWLRDLMAKAYHVSPENVSGPSWIAGNGAQLYFFTATMPPETSQHSFELMLQRFVREQFRISLHQEAKAFPAYDLVVGTGGPKLALSADQSVDPNTSVVLNASQMKIGMDGFATLPPGHGMVLQLGPGGGYYGTFQAYLMSQFVDFLCGEVTPPGGPNTYVVDKTGLTGLYDFKLKFDSSKGLTVGAETLAAGATQGSEFSGAPTIFKAVDQQLGLKLIRASAISMGTIVIDHAERTPVGN